MCVHPVSNLNITWQLSSVPSRIPKSFWTSEAHNKMCIDTCQKSLILGYATNWRAYMRLEVSIDCYERKEPKSERVDGFEGRSCFRRITTFNDSFKVIHLLIIHPTHPFNKTPSMTSTLDLCASGRKASKKCVSFFQNSNKFKKLSSIPMYNFPPNHLGHPYNPPSMSSNQDIEKDFWTLGILLQKMKYSQSHMYQ